jgi:hypothetical protein
MICLEGAGDGQIDRQIWVDAGIEGQQEESHQGKQDEHLEQTSAQDADTGRRLLALDGLLGLFGCLLDLLRGLFYILHRFFQWVLILVVIIRHGIIPSCARFPLFYSIVPKAGSDWGTTKARRTPRGESGFFGFREIKL